MIISMNKHSRKAKQIVNASLQCSACKEWKILDDFNNQKGKTTGKNSSCKICVRKRNGNRHDILDDSNPIISNGKRVCKVCGEEKSLIEFGKTKEGKFGRSYKCKICRVKLEIPRQRKDLCKKLYGITFEEKTKMLSEQMGLCANRACGKTIKLDTNNREEMACVDHNHATGKIRAILCVGCNFVLGHLEMAIH